MRFLLLFLFLFLLNLPSAAKADPATRNQDNFSCETNHAYAPKSPEKLVCDSYDQWINGNLSNDDFFVTLPIEKLPTGPRYIPLRVFIYEQTDFKKLNITQINLNAQFLAIFYGQPLLSSYDDQKAIPLLTMNAIQHYNIPLSEKDSQTCLKEIKDKTDIADLVIFQKVTKEVIMPLCHANIDEIFTLAQSYQDKVPNTDWYDISALYLYEMLYLKAEHIQDQYKQKEVRQKIRKEINDMSPFFHKDFSFISTN